MWCVQPLPTTYLVIGEFVQFVQQEQLGMLQLISKFISIDKCGINYQLGGSRNMTFENRMRRL